VTPDGAAARLELLDLSDRRSVVVG